MNKTDFYNSILNIGATDNFDIIEEIVIDEKNKLEEETTDLTGFCKYLASCIEERLREKSINTTYLDLNDIIGINHVILIAKCKINNELKNILIDPTFSQFTKNDNMKLIGLTEWPSEKINIITKKSLLENGLTEIDNDTFSDYLNSFTETNINYDIDKIILEEKINNVK